MATIQVVLEVTETDGVLAPPSMSDLADQWGWTPEPGVVRKTEVADLGDGTRVYQITGPDSLIAAIEASA